MDAPYFLSAAITPLTRADALGLIQAITAVIALALAIYVPVRMRRIEELERRDAIISSMRMVKQITNHYAITVGDLNNNMGTPPIELSAAIAACKGHLESPVTPATLLPPLSHIEHAARLVSDHWNMAASNAQLRANQKFLEVAKMRVKRVSDHLAAAETQLASWRRQHRVALFLS